MSLVRQHRGVIDDYLRRLGLEREAPSVRGLHRLHRAHVERVPYETVWIHTGEHYSCSSKESLARIARTSRGGYCFHLNGAFSELLAALGYNVVCHVGGVHGPVINVLIVSVNNVDIRAAGLLVCAHRASL